MIKGDFLPWRLHLFFLIAIFLFVLFVRFFPQNVDGAKFYISDPYLVLYSVLFLILPLLTRYHSKFQFLLTPLLPIFLIFGLGLNFNFLAQSRDAIVPKIYPHQNNRLFSLIEGANYTVPSDISGAIKIDLDPSLYIRLLRSTTTIDASVGGIMNVEQFEILKTQPEVDLILNPQMFGYWYFALPSDLEKVHGKPLNFYTFKVQPSLFPRLPTLVAVEQSVWRAYVAR